MSTLDERHIVEIRGLTIDFALRRGKLRAVNRVDFDIRKGNITALVGESGSGKSTLASSLLNLVSPPGAITAGEIVYKGQNILAYSPQQLQQYKWKEVSMVFQAAQNALNPVMTVRKQIVETVQAHMETPEKQIIEKASGLLEYVRLEPKRVLDSYPHELSGGMKQRVVIAFSLLLDPKLVILDEPTTALDVITQDYIFEILTKVHRELGITMLLLTHDIAVVAKVADRVGVMYGGHVVETGDVFDIFKRPKHPYTKQLLESTPSLVDTLRERVPIVGSPPNLLQPPPGCSFHPRCGFAVPACSQVKPEHTQLDNGQSVACHLYGSPVPVSEEGGRR